MKTKSKTAKASPKATAAQPFTPKPDLNILERGGEFLSLREQGMSPDDIRAMYKSKFGIKFSTPTFYNALRIAQAPTLVRKAIRSGAVKASEILPLLKRSKNQTLDQYKEKLIQGIEALSAERERKMEVLKKSGFTPLEDGQSMKLTKNRKVAMVAQSLQKVRKNSTALKNVRQNAVLDFIKGLEQNRSVEELLKQLEA